MVHGIARRLANRLPPTVEETDLVAYGMLGLVKAMNAFDPRRRVRFRDYAATRIYGAMIDGLREWDHINRDTRRAMSKIQSAAECFSELPSEEELAVASGVPIKTVRNIRSTMIPVSAHDFCRIVEETPDPEADDACRSIQARQVRDLLRASTVALKPRLRRILELYYFGEMQMKDIGRELGVAESRVSQLHADALCELRTQLRYRGLTEFSQAA